MDQFKLKGTTNAKKLESLKQSCESAKCFLSGDDNLSTIIELVEANGSITDETNPNYELKRETFDQIC